MRGEPQQLLPVSRMPKPMGRQWKPAGRPEGAGSCQAVIQHTWLFNAAYCSPQFFLSLQDKCDHCSICFTSLPQQHSIHHWVLLGGRIRLCRYNNSIHHRRAGVGKQRFVNDSGSLAAQIPPISLTGNTSVPSSPRAVQPEEPDPLPPRRHGSCHPVVHQPGHAWLLWRGRLSRPASPSENTQSNGSTVWRCWYPTNGTPAMSDGLRLAAADSGPVGPKGTHLQPPMDFGSFALGPHQVPVPPCGCVTHEKPEYQRLLVLSQTTDTHAHAQTYMNTYTDTQTQHVCTHRAWSC